MNTFLKKSNITGFLVTVICGPLLHFLFQWSGKNPVIGLFSAINESTWEHMKLLYMPVFVYFLLEYRKYKDPCENLLIARTLGLFCGIAFIPISFYTYSGIIGQNFLWADILVFAVSAFLTFYLSSKFLSRPMRLTALAALLLLLIVLALFFLFTFWPPHIDLFLDPVHFTYGIA